MKCIIYNVLERITYNDINKVNELHKNHDF